MNDKTKALVEQLKALREKCDEQHVPKDLSDFITRISAHTERAFSFNNLLLAFAQTNGKATRLHAVKTWNSLGKRIRKGVHGIKILVPKSFEKVGENGAKVRIRYYTCGYLFDESQVEDASKKAA